MEKENFCIECRFFDGNNGCSLDMNRDCFEFNSGDDCSEFEGDKTNGKTKYKHQGYRQRSLALVQSAGCTSWPIVGRSLETSCRKGGKAMKHTPGPWERCALHVAKGNIVVASCYKDNDTSVMQRPKGNGECLANARLIAAAPDLLEACKAVLLWAKTPGNHGGNPYCHEFVKLAVSAIKKAEGGE